MPLHASRKTWLDMAVAHVLEEGGEGGEGGEEG